MLNTESRDCVSCPTSLSGFPQSPLRAKLLYTDLARMQRHWEMHLSLSLSQAWKSNKRERRGKVYETQAKLRRQHSIHRGGTAFHGTRLIPGCPERGGTSLQGLRGPRSEEKGECDVNTSWYMFPCHPHKFFSSNRFRVSMINAMLVIFQVSPLNPHQNLTFR